MHTNEELAAAAVRSTAEENPCQFERAGPTGKTSPARNRISRPKGCRPPARPPQLPPLLSFGQETVVVPREQRVSPVARPVRRIFNECETSVLRFPRQKARARHYIAKKKKKNKPNNADLTDVCDGKEVGGETIAGKTKKKNPRRAVTALEIKELEYI